MNKYFLTLMTMLFLLFAGTAQANPAEDPHAIDPDKMPHGFTAGELPLHTPEGTNEKIRELNRDGMDYYLKRDFKAALKEFQNARKLAPWLGEILYNEALTLDKLDQHKKAAIRFQQAKDHAKGNKLILESPVLQAHLER